MFGNITQYISAAFLLLKNSRIARYVFSGGTAAAVNLAATWLLEKAGINYIAVVTIAFALSLLVSFTLQKFLTFSDGTAHRTHAQFGLFLLMALGNLVANDVLVYVQHDVFHFGQLVVEQAVASAIIAAYSFFAYRAIFRAPAAASAGQSIQLP